MIIGFSIKVWEECLYWQQHDKKISKRINLIIQDIKRNPYDKVKISKPEKLKANLSSYYSRRITSEHRLVYKIVDDLIIVAQCRYHY